MFHAEDLEDYQPQIRLCMMACCFHPQHQHCSNMPNPQRWQRTKRGMDAGESLHDFQQASLRLLDVRLEFLFALWPCQVPQAVTLGTLHLLPTLRKLLEGCFAHGRQHVHPLRHRRPQRHRPCNNAGGKIRKDSGDGCVQLGMGRTALLPSVMCP